MYFGRGKNKIKVDKGFPELYKAYKKECDNPIDKNTFKSIIKEFNNKMLDSVIYEGDDFSFAYRMGSLRIRKFDYSLKVDEEGNIKNRLKPNWEKTLKRWKELYPDHNREDMTKIEDKPIIYHLNEHTDGYVFKWYWDKITCNAPNQTAYRIEVLRDTKRKASKAWQEIPGLKDKYYC